MIWPNRHIYGGAKLVHFQFNKIGDSHWYEVETGDLLAIEIFLDFIKLFNGYSLNKDLF